MRKKKTTTTTKKGGEATQKVNGIKQKKQTWK